MKERQREIGLSVLMSTCAQERNTVMFSIIHTSLLNDVQRSFCIFIIFLLLFYSSSNLILNIISTFTFTFTFAISECSYCCMSVSARTFNGTLTYRPNYIYVNSLYVYHSVLCLQNVNAKGETESWKKMHIKKKKEAKYFFLHWSGKNKKIASTWVLDKKDSRPRQIKLVAILAFT